MAREASAAVRVQEFGLRSALQRNTLKDRRVDPRPKQYRYRRDVQVEEQRDGHPKPTVRRAVVWEDRQQERESERGEPPQGHGENRAGATEGNMRFVSGAKRYTTDMTSAGRSSVTGIRSRPTAEQRPRRSHVIRKPRSYPGDDEHKPSRRDPRERDA